MSESELLRTTHDSFKPVFLSFFLSPLIVFVACQKKRTSPLEVIQRTFKCNVLFENDFFAVDTHALYSIGIKDPYKLEATTTGFGSKKGLGAFLQRCFSGELDLIMTKANSK